MTDQTKYWESLKTGNITGLESLYTQYVDVLYRYGIVLCHEPDKVKDCIHDLFVYVWNSREHLNIPDSSQAYLMASLRRRLFDKGPKLHSMIDSLDMVSERDLLSSGNEEKWIESEEESANQKKLDNALSQLSDRQREIIYMKYYQQMEYEEIGRIMGLNYQSARNLVNRALSVLRKEMLFFVMLLLICQ